MNPIRVAQWTIAVFMVLCCSACARRGGPRSVPGPKASQADAPADCAATGPQTLRKLQTSPVIDGTLDDACWQEAAPVRVDYIKSELGELSRKPRMRARYAWDDHYFYIGYEVFDENLQCVGTQERQGPAGNQREGVELAKREDGKLIRYDLAEFFISFGSERCFWEIHQNALNHFNDVWIMVPDKDWPIYDSTMLRWGIYFGSEAFLKDDGTFRVARATHLLPKADGTPSTVNDASDTDTGYSGELRLPWRSLGPSAKRKPRKPEREGGEIVGPVPTKWRMRGQEMWILAVVQNGDCEGFYFHSCPTGTPSWFHTCAAEWPRYVLVDESAAEAAQP